VSSAAMPVGTASQLEPPFVERSTTDPAMRQRTDGSGDPISVRVACGPRLANRPLPAAPTLLSPAGAAAAATGDAGADSAEADGATPPKAPCRDCCFRASTSGRPESL